MVTLILGILIGIVLLPIVYALLCLMQVLREGFASLEKSEESDDVEALRDRIKVLEAEKEKLKVQNTGLIDDVCKQNLV